MTTCLECAEPFARRLGKMFCSRQCQVRFLNRNNPRRWGFRRTGTMSWRDRPNNYQKEER